MFAHQIIQRWAQVDRSYMQLLCIIVAVCATPRKLHAVTGEGIIKKISF